MLQEQFDFLNKTITSMYAERVCLDIKIKLNLADSKKLAGPQIQHLR